MPQKRSALNSASDWPNDCALHSHVSTASFYNLHRSSSVDTQNLRHSDASKVSLWDLRNDVKAAAAAAESNEGSISVPADLLQRMLLVMREHVQHNKVQRSLRRELRGALARGDSLGADVQRLSAEVRSDDRDVC